MVTQGPGKASPNQVTATHGQAPRDSETKSQRGHKLRPPPAPASSAHFLFSGVKHPSQEVLEVWQT